ncbi:BYR3 protein, partial [Pseudoatta argentina]
MRELVPQGSIDVESTIQYIIDGIPDDSSKMKLYEAQNYNEFRSRLRVYEKIQERGTTAMKNNPNKEVANKANKVDTKSVKKEKKTTKPGERCYNCGESGYRSDKCKFRDKGKKCFHCNNFGHEAKNCPDKNKSNTTQVMSNILVKAVDVNRMFKQVIIENKSLFKTFKTLKLHESEVLLTGIAQGRLTLDLLIQAEVRIDKDGIAISKPNVSIFLSQIELQPTKEAKNVAEGMMREYKPKKSKTTDIELSITLKDKTPIFQAPRRLPLKEKEIIENQVNKWVSEEIIEPSEYGSPHSETKLKIYCVHNLSGSILKSTFWGILLLYLDDLIIIAPNVEEGIKRLCQNGTIHSSPGKIQAVSHFPEPLTLKDVQSFLGLSEYFRKFIESYAIKAKPLSDLLRKENSFRFNVKEKESFKQLKSDLSNSAVLRIFNPKFETELHTAAYVLKEKPYDDYTMRNDVLYKFKDDPNCEVITKLQMQSQTFGNPAGIITDRGTAFSSLEFQNYCEEGIKHSMVTTGLPRANGQVERLNRTIIPILTKLAMNDLTKWYKYVPIVQQIVNFTFHRSISMIPFELLIEVKMKQKNDLTVKGAVEGEFRLHFEQDRDRITKTGKSNRKTYNLRRREPIKYKLCAKYLGPYKVVRVKSNNYYDVEHKVPGEGPKKTSSCEEYMKPWSSVL